jgi:predicted flap endonuclease-1-like 5' DNA nuclease
MFAAGSAEHETPAAEHVVDKAPEPIGDGEDVNAHDDLKMIKGIGPSIEKTLNDLGVYRFHQIAEMSEYDIDRVAQQLRGFRSRIYREDWIGQARDLQYQKNNDRS